MFNAVNSTAKFKTALVKMKAGIFQKNQMLNLPTRRKYGLSGTTLKRVLFK